MMLIGAAYAIWAVVAGYPIAFAVLAGAVSGGVASLLFGILALTS